jgi:hypothetical protein
MKEFKKQTPWVFTSERTVIRFDYGFSCYPGNGQPYFSITGEEWEARAGANPSPRGRDCISCGCLHRQIPASLEALRAAVPYHLFGTTHGPMHYQANALYRLQQAAGDFDGTIHQPKPNDPDPFMLFKSHVCFGQLATDTEADVKVLLRTGVDDHKLWLANRLPHLMLRFQEVVVKRLGLENEYKSAIACF